MSENYNFVIYSLSRISALISLIHFPLHFKRFISILALYGITGLIYDLTRKQKKISLGSICV